MTALVTPRVMPTSIMQAFVKLCILYAIPMNHRVPAFTQLGSVPMKTAAKLGCQLQGPLNMEEGNKSETHCAH